MKRHIVFGIATLCFAATTAHAQSEATRPFSFGVSAGASLPMGDFGDAAETGYNVSGLIEARQSAGPLGFRGEVGYHRFGLKGLDGNFRMITGIANGLYRFSTQPGAQVAPYVIAGVGIYNGKSSASASGVTVSSDAESKFGLNAGAGIDIPLSGIATFIEARFHSVFTEGQKTNMIPVTVGIRF